MTFDFYFLSEREWLDQIKLENTRMEIFVINKYESWLRKSLHNKFRSYQFKGQEADDFCQDVLVRFLLRAREEGGSMLKQERTIKHWFMGNVTKIGLETWRNRKKAKEILTDYMNEATTFELSKSAYLQTKHFETDINEAMQKAIERLDEEESPKFDAGFVKKLCAYRFVHGMPWKEVTEALNKDFPNYKNFPMERSLTWEYVSRSLWSGNYDKRLADLLKPLRE